MDARGKWHYDDGKPSGVQEMLSGKRDRSVISCAVGEIVRIEKTNGEMLRCRFDAANENKVTLQPMDEPVPYLELAEHVTLTNSTNVSVQAQVWDNRGGKIIIRTLPV